jgi:hypothetical protein
VEVINSHLSIYCLISYLSASILNGQCKSHNLCKSEKKSLSRINLHVIFGSGVTWTSLGGGPDRSVQKCGQIPKIVGPAAALAASTINRLKYKNIIIPNLLRTTKAKVSYFERRGEPAGRK